MPLTLGSQPGFTEIADSAFDAGNAVTAANMKALNADAKFAAVRNEQFWGYFKNGETVPLSMCISPADGYAYARNELLYSWSVYYTAAPPGSALNGTHSPPAGGATSGAGHLLAMNYNVDQTTGAVTCSTQYHKDGGSQTTTTDGILLVIIHAQRLR